MKFSQVSREHLGNGLWEDVGDLPDGRRLRIRYRWRVYQEPPWMELETISVEAVATSSV